MKNKAFTLVELLGVIVILGILGIVIIPKVGDSITNSKETALLTQEEQIKKAAHDFLIDNIELLEKTDRITIKLGLLKQKGYLPINIKNPKTRKNISNESVITITKIGNEYDIQLNLIDLEDVTENIDNNSPIIVLNGDYVEYVEVNTLYQEKGATAKTSTGQKINNISIQIKLNNEEQTNIDTSQMQTYNIVYSATDENGKTTSATRTVIVRDSTAPTITVPKETTLHSSEVATFDIMDGVSISDNYYSNVNLNINSSLAALPGNYVITYTATDSSGNETTERRVINVNNDWSKYYTNVEYIESTGTQYINLNYKAKTNTETSLDIELIENDNTYLSNQVNHIIGRETSTNENTFTVNFGSLDSEYRTIYYWVDKTFSSGATIYTGTYWPPTTRSIMILKSGSATFQSQTTTVATKTADNVDGMILLGTYNSTANTIQAFNRYDAKVYGFQIYEGTTLIRNFIPAMRNSDNEVGLYDLVNEVFYTNAGTGSFNAGNPIN